MRKAKEAAFIDAAHLLSHEAPEHWQRMVAAFEEYAREKCIEAVAAPLDHAHVAKGHAQGFMLLAETLKEIEARYAALRKMEARTGDRAR